MLSDRILREDLFTTPERAYDEGLELAQALARPGPHALRRHPALLALLHRRAAGVGRRRCSRDGPELWFTSHLNENVEEIEGVRRAVRLRLHDVSYDEHGLLGPRSVLAHNVHPTAAGAA